MAKTILIVEDDPLLVKMYQTKFVSEGYEVLIATDGMMGWKLVKERKPDLLVMDVMMPRLSGKDLLRAIRQDEGLKNMKVIIMSNLTSQTETDELKRLGVLEFLVKANFTPSQIVGVVKKYLA